jgi:hypothetical protein
MSVLEEFLEFAALLPFGRAAPTQIGALHGLGPRISPRSITWRRRPGRLRRVDLAQRLALTLRRNAAARASRAPGHVTRGLPATMRAPPTRFHLAAARWPATRVTVTAIAESILGSLVTAIARRCKAGSVRKEAASAARAPPADAGDVQSA